MLKCYKNKNLTVKIPSSFAMWFSMSVVPLTRSTTKALFCAVCISLFRTRRSTWSKESVIDESREHRLGWVGRCGRLVCLLIKCSDNSTVTDGRAKCALIFAKWKSTQVAAVLASSTPEGLLRLEGRTPGQQLSWLRAVDRVSAWSVHVDGRCAVLIARY